jgi:adenosylhomocysteine nucleosidase
MKEEIVIVAAMEREIGPLVRHWRRVRLQQEDWTFAAFVNDIAGGNVLAVAAGMGPEAARRATEAALASKPVKYVISAGWAGAADPALQVAKVMIPARVVDASSGKTFEVAGGEGTLVTVAGVAGTADKARYRQQHGADLLEMEASAVAAVAQDKGIEFLAVKAVSDVSELPMPPMDEFRGPRGEFLTAKFVTYMLFRPRWWKAVRQMAKDSKAASRSLCAVLEDLIEKGLEARN